MFKVLIVDDEQGICDLISCLIDWDGLQFELTGTENNGLDAYRIICEKKPDLVITDIRMPGLDGLELIERCNAMEHHPRFIVISGHRDFEYAQRALKFRVEDYLLKPVDELELNTLLGKVKQQMISQCEEESAAGFSHCSKHQVCMLRQNQIREIIYNPKAKLDDGLFEDNSGWYTVLVVKIDFYERKDVERWSAVKILGNIGEQLGKVVRENGFTCESLNENWEQIILIHAPKKEIEEQKDLKKLCSRVLRDNQQKYCNLNLTLMIGKVFWELSDAGEMIVGTRSCLNKRFENPKINVWDVDVINEITPFDDQSEAELTDRIVEDVFTSPQDQIETIIKQFFRSIDARKWLALSKQLLSQLMEYISIKDITIEKCQEQIQELSEWLEHCITMEQFSSSLCSFIELLYKKKQRRDREPVLQAKRYIEDHIDRQITLTEISDFVNFSPTYFSSYFKEKTGVGFGDYVIKVRMEKAMYYLRNSELSIYDIAEKVGYADAKHFSKVFRRIVKVKPTEYRRLHL